MDQRNDHRNGPNPAELCPDRLMTGVEINDRIPTNVPATDGGINNGGHDLLGQAVTLSLDGVLMKAVADQESHLGAEMREYLAKGRKIPKKLIYITLKKALDDIDSSRPVLIIDRMFTRAVTESDDHETYPTVGNSRNGDVNNDDSTRTNDNAVTYIHINDTHASDNQQTDDQTQNAHRPTTTNVDGSKVNGDKPRRSTGTWQQRFRDRLESMFGNLSICRRRKVANSEKKKQTESGQDQSTGSRKRNWFFEYFRKMRGNQKRAPYEEPVEALYSLLISFLGILSLSSIDYFCLDNTEYTLLIGSFGATAVLVFCAIRSPLAQPRNVIGGHLLAGVIGAACQMTIGHRFPWLAAALAVSLSIAVMSLTNTVHPPAGATALIAVYSDNVIHNLGFLYALIPVGLGAIILVFVALVLNNLCPTRRYPLYWF